jgi:peptide/nickel transport system permease protein
MIAYLQRRLFQALIVFVIVNTITFALIRVAPGLPEIMTGNLLTNQDRALFRHNLGLDKPVQAQYLIWWSHIVRGDFGTSWTEHSPVLQVLVSRLPNTLILATVAMLFSVVIGIMAGIISATRPYSVLDYTVTSLSLVGLSVPSFWLGLMLILGLSVHWHIFPSSGMYTIGADPSVGDRLRHLVLPAFVLSAGTLAQLTRFTRSSLLEVLGFDYIRTARAKGIRESVVLQRHALKNAIIPVITIIGLQVPRFIGGSIIVESIFAWPGIGRLAYSSAISRDYPMIMGITVMISMVVLIVNIGTDLVYSFVDPRIRFE